MEGVSIRARIKEQTEGERPSSSLLSKQSSSKAKTKISEIKTEYHDDTSTNTVLNSQVSIMNYITESFQNQYEDVATDKNKQDWFLSFIEKCVTKNDNKSLISFISDEEIYLTIKSFNNNKSPGIDGLPIEFYINFFHIIRTEFCEMIRNSFRIKQLIDSQRKAIIILLFKGGDCKLLSSRRPISLICVDTKIMSKIIANRLKPIMKSCISNEQFCGSDKSIIECNNVTRDMLYYINEQNITCALINIDLQKAFDSVNHSFLFSVMKKMGFSLEFISFIQMFYNEVVSVCLVNGHQGNSFNIKRGVRQGCPLSMLLYVLAQEPLYRALKASTQIQAIDIPCKETKLLGFADDTSIFVNSILSIISVFNILKDFGNASGIQVNNKKTKIMGFGGWMDRTEWPISDLKTQSSDITILGIIFCREINVAINLTWDKILSNIRIMTRLLSGRHFTLHQRAIIVNTLILSKVWYVAHTYPLPKRYANLISKEVFEFLWKSKLNPIKRDVVYQEKNKGGLGVFNVLLKSQCIIASTFLKHFLDSQENDSFLKYFCSIRVNPIFNIRELPEKVTYVCPWYFNDIIINIRKCLHYEKFPCIRSSGMYDFLLSETKPLVNERHNFRWGNIWKNINFRYINVYEREIIFKFIHEILPTNSKLYQMKQKNSPLCLLCNTREDSNHMFLKCKKIQNILEYFKTILLKVCNITYDNMEQILYLDIKSQSKKHLNTIIILTVQYIATVWYNRARDTHMDPVLFETNIVKHHKLLSLILKDKMQLLFTEKYCQFNTCL